MKDIRKLKIWPFLKETGFVVNNYKDGGRIAAKGAILPLKNALKLNEVKANYILMEIEPLTYRNIYRCVYDYPIGSKNTAYFTAFELQVKLPEIIKKMKL